MNKQPVTPRPEPSVPVRSDEAVAGRQTGELAEGELLAFSDLLLWIAQYLKPAQRGDGGRPQWERSSPAELDELCQRTGLVEAGLTGAELAHVEELFSHESGAEAVRLFEGPIHCPTNETAYVRRDKGRILADLEGFYRAFGFRLSSNAAEKGDHIVVELEFAALLLIKLARATSSDDSPEATDAVGVTRRALDAFLCDHLNEWLTLFAHRLAGTTERRSYAELAGLLLVCWTRFGHWLGLSDRFAGEPSTDPSIALDADGTPYECGMVEGNSGPGSEFPV